MGHPGPGGAFLRKVVDADSDGVIALIDSCYAEYPPNILDVDLEEPELRHPARDFEAFWVVEDAEGRIVGCIAGAVLEAGRLAELKKCYVCASQRGTGWGRRLISVMEEWALEQGCGEVELWTDTRFTLAHKVYAALGYRSTGRTRDLHDLSGTTEFQYRKTL